MSKYWAFINGTGSNEMRNDDCNNFGIFDNDNGLITRKIVSYENKVLVVGCQ